MARSKSYIVGFWDRFDRLCMERNISKSELARRVGCERKSLYSCSGATPQPLILAKICVQLNVSADYLLGIKTKYEPLNRSIV
jgi:transcriptional regulator with XRE-family HTH domain